MLNFRNFFQQSVMIVIKLNIKEMHFKNAYHLAHAL